MLGCTDAQAFHIRDLLVADAAKHGYLKMLLSNPLKRGSPVAAPYEQAHAREAPKQGIERPIHAQGCGTLNGSNSSILTRADVGFTRQRTANPRSATPRVAVKGSGTAWLLNAACVETPVVAPFEGGYRL